MKYSLFMFLILPFIGYAYLAGLYASAGKRLQTKNLQGVGVGLFLLTGGLCAFWKELNGALLGKAILVAVGIGLLSVPWGIYYFNKHIRGTKFVLKKKARVLKIVGAFLVSLMASYGTRSDFGEMLVQKKWPLLGGFFGFFFMIVGFSLYTMKKERELGGPIIAIAEGESEA